MSEDMKMNPVGWFEIPVLDVDRAEKFYAGVFGFAFDRKPEKDGMTMSWFPSKGMDVYGAAGVLVKHPAMEPSAKGTVVYFSTDDLDAACGKVAEFGGKVVMPAMSISEHGFIAYAHDSEGGVFALHTMNKPDSLN